MTDYKRKVRRLVAEAAATPAARTRVSLLESATALADTHNDIPLGYEVREKLVGAALDADDCPRMMVAFAWRLARYDRSPDEFPWAQLLWELRWVVSSLADFPDVPRAKIEEMKADMARRYQAAGASPRSFALMCRKMAIDMGDRAAADDAHGWYRRCPLDWLSDGPATEAGFDVGYRLFRNEYARALREAAPFFDGRIRDAHFEPQLCADVLFPLLRAGRAAEGMSFHRRGYRRHRGNPRHLDSIGKHIVFLALTGNAAKAIGLVELHLPLALASKNPATRLYFLLDALVLFDNLRAKDRADLRFRAPDDCPVPGEKGRYPVVAIREWLYAITADLARAFDARNENDYYARRLGGLPKLHRWFTPTPLSS